MIEINMIHPKEFIETHRFERFLAINLPNSSRTCFWLTIKGFGTAFKDDRYYSLSKVKTIILRKEN